MNASGIIGNVAKVIAKNSTTILTVLGVTGFGMTIGFAIKAAPAGNKVHDAHKIERCNIRESGRTDEDRRKAVALDIWQEVKDLAPIYGPTAGMSVVSIACFLGASKIQADRQAALMAAYSLSEKTLTTYQKKVIERLGDDAHKEVLDDTTRDIAQHVPKTSESPLAIKEGLTRCYDNVTGRYFYSTREAIVSAESEINKRLLDEVRVPLQEFYYYIGIEERFCLGEAMGWDISRTDGSVLNVWFTPMLDDEKNPCLALNYHVVIFDRSV